MVLLLLCVFSGVTAISETFQGPNDSWTVWDHLRGPNWHWNFKRMLEHVEPNEPQDQMKSPFCPWNSGPGVLSEIAANLFCGAISNLINNSINITYEQSFQLPEKKSRPRKLWKLKRRKKIPQNPKWKYPGVWKKLYLEKIGILIVFNLVLVNEK